MSFKDLFFTSVEAYKASQNHENHEDTTPAIESQVVDLLQALNVVPSEDHMNHLSDQYAMCQANGISNQHFFASVVALHPVDPFASLKANQLRLDQIAHKKMLIEQSQHHLDDLAKQVCDEQKTIASLKAELRSLNTPHATDGSALRDAFSFFTRNNTLPFDIPPNVAKTLKTLGFDIPTREPIAVEFQYKALPPPSNEITTFIRPQTNFVDDILTSVSEGRRYFGCLLYSQSISAAVTAAGLSHIVLAYDSDPSIDLPISTWNVANARHARSPAVTKIIACCLEDNVDNFHADIARTMELSRSKIVTTTQPHVQSNAMAIAITVKKIAEKFQLRVSKPEPN